MLLPTSSPTEPHAAPLSLHLSFLLRVAASYLQEFIRNNTEFYNTDRHGYWIGYRATEDTWQWTDGSNGTVTSVLLWWWRCIAFSPHRAPWWPTVPFLFSISRFWIQHQSVWYRESCALAQRLGSLDNWRKTSCGMRNRWICEMRTLIK